MADVNTGDSGGGGGKHQKKRAKKSSTRIDMTPMVDLAFLLLTFFVLTSTFAKPKTMEINYPADPKTKEERQKVNNALTFLLTEKDGIFWYYGAFMAEGMPNPDGDPLTVINKTDYSSQGLHELLLKYNDPTVKEIQKLTEDFKNKVIENDSIFKVKVNEVKGNPKALTVLVKSDDKAIYKNIIDMIDELNICNIGKYAVVDMEAKELELLNAAKNK